MPGLQELYHQHPVAFLGIVGGGALAAAYVVSQRGKSNSAVTPYPVAGYGSQGFGYLGPPVPTPSIPCWLTGDCSQPGGDPTSPPTPYPSCQTTGCPAGQVCTALGCVPIPGPAPCSGDNCNPPIRRCGPGTDRICPPGGGYGGGFGMTDFDFMRSYVDAKQRVDMRIGLGV